MIKLELRLFCRLQWKYEDISIIANTKEEALQKLDEVYPLRDRTTPYSEGKDSLKIIYEEESDCFIEISGGCYE